jgi:DNA-binding SARP family transcriptional activator
VLYQGGLFEDDPYEDWVIARRRESQDAHVAVLERLRDHYLAVRDHETCIAASREILAAEPSSEDTHRVLMRCYARQGHHHLALRQYQDCARALQDALGALPDAATEGLHALVRTHAAI